MVEAALNFNRDPAQPAALCLFGLFSLAFILMQVETGHAPLGRLGASGLKVELPGQLGIHYRHYT